MAPPPSASFILSYFIQHAKTNKTKIVSARSWIRSRRRCCDAALFVFAKKQILRRKTKISQRKSKRAAGSVHGLASVDAVRGPLLAAPRGLFAVLPRHDGAFFVLIFAILGFFSARRTPEGSLLYYLAMLARRLFFHFVFLNVRSSAVLS